MPAIGGQPTRISSGGGRSPAWSPDGSEIADFLSPGPGVPTARSIQITSLRTREARDLQIPGARGNRHDLNWSPDGRSFAYVQAASLVEGISRVWLLRLSDAREIAVTDGTSNDWSPMEVVICGPPPPTGVRSLNSPTIRRRIGMLASRPMDNASRSTPTAAAIETYGSCPPEEAPPFR